MHKLLLPILAITFISCSTSQSQEAQVNATDTPATNIVAYNTDNRTPIKEDTIYIEQEIAEQTATLYVVIADTGVNYHLLRDRMISLHDSSKLSIDTMGRSWNSAKNLIALPDNDEDEIYAGDYFPRRYSSKDLSLEYLNFYYNEANEKTIALVAGICENKPDAEKILSLIKKQNNKAFLVKADIYMGCMH